MGFLDRLKNRNADNNEENLVENRNADNEDVLPEKGYDHNWNVPFHAYEGNEPYIFVSYAHKDAYLVYPELQKFHDDGVNVWYDQGIAPGNEWTDEIAEALAGCSLFIVFITNNSVNSINVRNEINYALDENKPFLAIHLEETEITGGLKLRISSLQAILKYTTTEDEYVWRYRKNFKMNGLLESDEPAEPQQQVKPPQEQSVRKTAEKAKKPQQNKKPARHNSKHLEEFERLNTTTNSIYDLEGHEVLIILRDGTNLTSWADVEWKRESLTYNDDVLYVSEDLSNFSDLSEKYSQLRALKAIVATGVTNRVTNMRRMFDFCHSLEDISSLSDWDTSGVTDMVGLFNSCYPLEDISALSNWDTSNVRQMDFPFGGCNCLEDISALSNWDTSKVEHMAAVFHGCDSLEDISALSNWDTSNVRSMERMFYGCDSIEDISALSNWDISKVEYIAQMFHGCDSIEDISALSNWDISKVENMAEMFHGCGSLEDISALSNWNTSKVRSMNGMFYGCGSLEDISALSYWNTSKVRDMSIMFEGCSFEDASCLDNWKTSKVKDMNGIFNKCDNIRTYPKWYKK